MPTIHVLHIVTFDSSRLEKMNDVTQISFSVKVTNGTLDSHHHLVPGASGWPALLSRARYKEQATRTHAHDTIREGEREGDQPASAFSSSRSPLVLQVAPVSWPPTELLCS